MLPADLTPPLTAAQIVEVRWLADHGHAGLCEEMMKSLADLLDAHAALTAQLAQRTAERNAMQARIDAANSVDGVTADDAPLMMDALAPAAAWVEGVQHGQEMALAALAAPTEG